VRHPLAATAQKFQLFVVAFGRLGPVDLLRDVRARSRRTVDVDPARRREQPVGVHEQHGVEVGVAVGRLPPRATRHANDMARTAARGDGPLPLAYQKRGSRKGESGVEYCFSAFS